MQRLSPSDSSKLLKAELRKAFPGTKFSVRLSRGTAYGSAHVSWEDGPEASAVQLIADRYEGKAFNGMDDSTTYLTKVVDGPDGEQVESGLGYVMLHRSVSEDAKAAARQELMFGCREDVLERFVEERVGEGKLFPDLRTAAFSLLSDAQEAIDFGQSDRANKTINRVKWMLDQMAA